MELVSELLTVIVTPLEMGDTLLPTTHRHRRTQRLILLTSTNRRQTVSLPLLKYSRTIPVSELLAGLFVKIVSIRV